MPVNWHYTEDEARYLFENSGAKAIVIHADLIEPVRAAIPAGVPVLVVETPPEIAEAYGIAARASRACRPGCTDWNVWLEGFAPCTGNGAPTAPGTIIYTSGTTGRPKGVRRTSADAGTGRRPAADPAARLRLRAVAASRTRSSPW